MNKAKEKIMQAVFLISALASVVAVAAICIFLFAQGLPAIAEIGPLKFLLGTRWKPAQKLFGILPMIVGSIYVTAGAVTVGVPIGILTAVFLYKYCPQKLYRLIKPAIDLLAGIPSIVYGFFALVVIVPIIQQLSGTGGKGMLTASLLLGIMILPTVISTSEAALCAVPASYYEGSLALGATKERSIFRIVIPAAIPGILSGVILAIGRIVGETAALIYTSGTGSRVATGLTDSARTLSVHMYCLLSEGFYTNEAYATAVVLLVVVIGINAASDFLAKRLAKGN